MLYLKGMQDYTVTIGTLVLHLEDFRITGNCTLREYGTAEGNGAVIWAYPRGTRIVLKGRLAPPAEHFAAAGAALDRLLREGTVQSLRIGMLRCRDARLIGYSMQQAEFPAELTLVFFTDTPLEEVGNECALCS